MSGFQLDAMPDIDAATAPPRPASVRELILASLIAFLLVSTLAMFVLAKFAPMPAVPVAAPSEGTDVIRRSR